MPSDLKNARVRLKFLNSNLNWILNPNGWGNNIFIFYYSKRVGDIYEMLVKDFSHLRLLR